MKAVLIIPGLLAGTGLFCGCGAAGNSRCVVAEDLWVGPATAMAVSSAKAPADQVRFLAHSTNFVLNPGTGSDKNDCVLDSLIEQTSLTWTNPDPLDISIDSSSTAGNGTAVCLHPTSAAVTLTGTPIANGEDYVPASVAVSLTCQ